MTVCIAAIAAKGTAIVLVADRAISSMRGGQVVLKAESGVGKIRELYGDWVGMISGPVDFGEATLFTAEVSYQVKREAEVGSSMGIPECVKIAYQASRKISVLDRILKPRLLDEEWYERKINDPISRGDHFFNSIADEIKEYFTESTLLICGFEYGIPEIYIVSDPGIINSASPEGFGVIGIGDDTAKNRLFTLETDPSDPIEKVLYDAYDAKEACAESLPDVGHEWDAVILIKGKRPVRVPEEIEKLIENLYKSHKRSPFDEGRMRFPRNWRSRLSAYVSSIVDNSESSPEDDKQPIAVASRKD